MGDQHKGDIDIRGQSRKQLSEGLEAEVPNPYGLQLELRVRGDEQNPQFLSIFRICRPHPTWGYAFSTIVGRKGNIQ